MATAEILASAAVPAEELRRGLSGGINQTAEGVGMINPACARPDLARTRLPMLLIQVLTDERRVYLGRILLPRGDELMGFE